MEAIKVKYANLT